MLSLNKKQQQAHDYIVVDKQSVCLLSRAGFGKTFLANQVINSMRGQGYTILTAAFTGNAASLLDGGITAHKASAMGLGSKNILPKGIAKEGKAVNGIFRNPMKDCLPRADKRWQAEKLLVVLDEISQFCSEDARLFYDIGMAKREAAQVYEEPIFLLLGDFGQFLPIDGSLFFEESKFTVYPRGIKLDLVLPSILDDICPKMVMLDTPMRQSDQKFIKALDWLYRGVAVHPIILDRVNQQPPSDCNTYYYNNLAVEQENQLRLSKFKNNTKQVYTAISSTLTSTEVKYLLPVTEKMTVIVGAPFTITVNVYEPIKNKLLACNGEVTKVISLKSNSIVVEKSNGDLIELNYVEHYLPFVEDQKENKRKTFLQLPGYPGDCCSLMKIQGKGFSTPTRFAVWQVMRGEFKSLKSQPGALYTICSRVEDLSLLYFDTSLGLETTKFLLKDSLKINSKVARFIGLDKENPYICDSNHNTFVIEATDFDKKLVKGTDREVYLVNVCYTCLKSGAEVFYVSVLEKSMDESKKWNLLKIGERLQNNTIIQADTIFKEAIFEVSKKLLTSSS